MSILSEELTLKISSIFRKKWSERSGQVVPSPLSVQLMRNDAVRLIGIVLYADMSESTKLVDNFPADFAAKIYKVYLHCCAKIIRSDSGDIVAYDGDRIMAIYIGNNAELYATRSAFKINYSLEHLINPFIKKNYPLINYQVAHTIGIDKSELFIANTGIRGSNDLVWVGRAANHAAKLCALPKDIYQTRITLDIYQKLPTNFKTHSGSPMWIEYNWNTTNRKIYTSNYYLRF